MFFEKKRIFLIIGLCVFFAIAKAQTPPPLYPKYPDYEFQSFQLSLPRVNQAYNHTNSSIQNEFRKKGILYPSKYLFFRAFKSSNEMELYAKNNLSDTFTLIKTYNVCALSGILGPKRWEGDRQVPEGFYFIESFNPRSDYHLSLLINYPNYSDGFFSNAMKPGGDIYIHGGCLTVGCLPMTNEIIEEIYTICMQSRTAGQMYIPIHIYPLRFTQKGLDFIGREYKNENEKHQFWVNIKRAYDYFENTHRILPVMYDENGNYVF